MNDLHHYPLHFVPTNPALSRAKVFVQLVHGFGASRWSAAWAKGELPGILDQLPYGYYRAANEHFQIEYSEDADESSITRFLRLALRRLLGFDFIHTWRNRRGLRSADIVWTHTELEHLAVLLVWRLTNPRPRPKLIAQSVWLYDRWDGFSAPKRWLYKKLLTGADFLTVLSPDNLVKARELFPGTPSEFLRFGIDAEALVPARKRLAHRPIRLLSLGRDMHRDWNTLIEAVKASSDCELKIAATRTVPRQVAGASNIELIRPTTASEIFALYQWADILVLPLHTNLHASGITVLAEAALSGVPVVVSDTGGLRAYFSDREVRYVPVKDGESLMAAVRELAADDELRFRLARAAQARIISDDLSSKAYALRHRELSVRLLYGEKQGIENNLNGSIHTATDASLITESTRARLVRRRTGTDL
jgi:glycosyltransferase involved in cell wall biosynthesis